MMSMLKNNLLENSNESSQDESDDEEAKHEMFDKLAEFHKENSSRM